LVSPSEHGIIVEGHSEMTILQSMVLKLGSKKALGTFLGIGTQELNELWSKRNLKSPGAHLKELDSQDIYLRVVIDGTTEKAAKSLGVSKSTLIKELRRRIDLPRSHGIKLWVAMREGKSISMATHLYNLENDTALSESAIREMASSQGLKPEWDFSDHSTGKGRRAELEYKKIRGDQIKRDLNEEGDTRAPYDFDDLERGRVNVKSSRAYKYKSRSRRGKKYWKFSTRGRDAADYFALMAYDESGKTLSHYWLLRTDDPRTQTGTITMERGSGHDNLRFHEVLD